MNRSAALGLLLLAFQLVGVACAHAQPALPRGPFHEVGYFDFDSNGVKDQCILDWRVARDVTGKWYAVGHFEVLNANGTRILNDDFGFTADDYTDMTPYMAKSVPVDVFFHRFFKGEYKQFAMTTRLVTADEIDGEYVRRIIASIHPDVPEKAVIDELTKAPRPVLFILGGYEQFHLFTYSSLLGNAVHLNDPH